MLSTKPNFFGWYADNFDSTPNIPYGTDVSCAANDAEGSWVEMLSAGTVANDVYAIELIPMDSWRNVAKLNTVLLDIAYGASDTVLISNLLAGSIEGSVNRAIPTFYFPIFVPAGNKISARIQTSYDDTMTMNVALRVWGRPSNPLGMWTGSFSETVGANTTDSTGTAVTLGASAWNTTIGTSAGNWHSMGTTTKRWQHVSLCMDNYNATSSDELSYWELGYGDGSNVHTVIHKRVCYSSSSENLARINSQFQAYCDIPAGSTIYVRGMGDASPDATYKALAVGIG